MSHRLSIVLLGCAACGVPVAMPDPDSGTPEPLAPDASWVDAGDDGAGTDSGVDAGAGGRDAGIDGGVDAGFDAGAVARDAGHADGGADAGSPPLPACPCWGGDGLYCGSAVVTYGSTHHCGAPALAQHSGDIYE